MDDRNEAKARAARTYNAAAEFFDHPINNHWERFGRRTIERAGLRPGEIVLDVCAGSGTSALPAAEQVGPGGKVVAVDLAEAMLGLARAKAEAKGLANIEFRVDDMLALGYPDASFDVVICAFGIFFVQDMPAAVSELWRMVRRGGRLAITTWGPNIFEPANGFFWTLIRKERPDLDRAFNPWDPISHPSGLRDMLRAAGVETDDIIAEPGTHALASPQDWWTMTMGSGYRGTLAQLDRATLENVRAENLRLLAEGRVNRLETDVIYAVARKD